ncbi:MAG: response regulator [Polyangia bacterium]
MPEADGQEVLVVDGDENVRKGMQSLLEELRVVPTVLADIDRAQALVREKYFAVAIVDLDTPVPGGALELLRYMHKEAPGTALIVLTARKVYEAAVDAFRAGATDVIVKAPGEIEYLKQRVLSACLHVRLTDSNERVLHDVFSLHEDFLKRLVETSRRAAELEEKLGGGAQSADADESTSLLVVEPSDDPWLGDALQKELATRKGYKLERVYTGGEALDVGATKRFQVVLIADGLPDLPGSMIATTLRAASPDSITILYSRPGAEPGRAQVIEGSRMIPLLASLTDAHQLVARLDELRQAFLAKSRERRYLGAFRQQNYELLRRFADLKLKLKQAADGPSA